MQVHVRQDRSGMVAVIGELTCITSVMVVPPSILRLLDTKR